ncbi:hypothetical protein [Ureibacillus thermosphaericus]|uniref:Uncharacterized protein n=2 Tax=Ureibacillus TaxID=160795 RepID=A0A840PLV7_URETH|nr:hypothetical protein [Ureibacillus thermosphaericus]MBB5149395.1 hypothetical protein [Ureibacillus thermosphaericus]NKZ32160.1 hypothetical protein [Ureibacillus thermosphaericus]
MTVSVGFFRKIYEWVVDGHSDDIQYRPFQVDGNPYKSRVFLVGLYPESLAYFDLNDIKMYADSLVDGELFEQLNGLEIIAASREYKGSLNFAQWMKKEFNENVVLTNVNCLLAKDYKQFKQMKKENHLLYLSGKQLFEKVLNEFSPEIIIIQGSKAFDEFREIYQERLIHKVETFETGTVQELEKLGVIAEYPLENGENVKVIACRNMSYFGKEGAAFGTVKEVIGRLLK